MCVIGHCHGDKRHFSAHLVVVEFLQWPAVVVNNGGPNDLFC